MNNEETIFLGPNKVEKIEDAGFKTLPLGSEIIRVTYAEAKDEKTGRVISPAPELFTRKCFDVIKTLEVSDLTTMRDKKVQAMVRELLTIFVEWGLKYSEQDFLDIMLNTSMQENNDKATTFLYGGADKLSRTVLHTQKILEEIEKLSTKTNVSGENTSSTAN